MRFSAPIGLGSMRAFSVCLLWILAACATAQVFDHTLSFDVRRDSPGVELLDYRYGDSNVPGTSNSEGRRKQGTSVQAFIVSGAMRRGNSLYAKWRIKDTGQVFEETADLRGKLPDDITDHVIYFIVRGPQLHVYLISPQRRPAEIPPNGPAKYRDRMVTTLHPEENKR
jgi:hypothetical protein